MSASSMPHCCSGVTLPTSSPRRPASTAPTCSTRIRVSSPSRSISGRKNAGRALRDVGATRTLTWARTRWLGPPRQIGGRVARVLGRVASGTRGCHPGARKLSITAAISIISCRSPSSASSAATSWASALRRCSRAALSMIARRIASDLLSPAASSWFSARSASSSKRRLIATVTRRVYHDSSYTTSPAGGPVPLVRPGVGRAVGRRLDVGPVGVPGGLLHELWGCRRAGGYYSQADRLERDQLFSPRHLLSYLGWRVAGAGCRRCVSSRWLR